MTTSPKYHALPAFILLLTLSLSLLYPASTIDAHDTPEVFPLMHPDEQTLREWVKAYDDAPRTESVSMLRSAALSGGSVDLLPHMVHVPSERSQGACGNCWAWAGTGCMEIALSVQEGIQERLSVQVLNSCRSIIGKSCCQGGWLYQLADFYTVTGRALPWDNVNAQWQDGDGGCSIPCEAIATEPYHDIASIQMLTIPTLLSQEVSTRAQAIANIKAELNSGKGVWFAFFAPPEGWQQFYSYWSGQGETAVINMDSMCSGTVNGGGHAVLCVGYNDSDPNNRYWVMLNSWGTAGGNRPNGLFRINMDMDYNTRCGIQAFFWQTLDIRFRLPPSVTTGEASVVAAQAATVHGTLEHDSGTPTDVRFEYGPLAGEPYPYATAWQSGLSSGDGLTAELSGLTPSTLYYYRAQAWNSGGTSFGDERTFFTLPAAPARFTADALGKDLVELAWLVGEGATGTVVWGKKDSPPAACGDGYLVYDGPGTSARDTTVQPGSAYYYRAWSFASSPIIPATLMSDEASNDCAHTIGEGVWMIGDVDLDGRVTIVDAMNIAQYSVALRDLSPTQLLCADTTNDGRVNVVDAMHIAQFTVDPDGAGGILHKALWESPYDEGLLDPLAPCAL